VQVYRRAAQLLATCMAQVHLQDATVQSVLLASAPIMDAAQGAGNGGGGGAAAAAAPLIALAMPGGGGGGAGEGWARIGLHRRSASADVHGSGGSGGAAGPPVAWGVGQLLPWQEGTAAGQVLALQQLLWKGLLFADTVLPTLQLFTLLSHQISAQPPPSRGSPSPAAAPPLARGGDGGSGALSRPVTPSDSRRRRQGGHHSRANSLRSSGGEVGGRALATGTLGPPPPPPGTVPLPSAYGAAALAQSQPQPLPPLHEHSDSEDGQHGGISAGSLPGAGSEVHAALSRSAPELGGISGHTPRQQQSAPDIGQPDQRRPGGSGGAPSLSHGKSSSGLPPTWQPGGGASPRPGGRGGSSAALLRRPSVVRRAYQALFGHRHAQIAVSVLGLVPLACARLDVLAATAGGGSSPAGAAGAAPAGAAAGAAVAAAAAVAATTPQLEAALRDALRALAAACAGQGMLGLALQVEALAAARPGELSTCLPRVAAALAAAFTPGYDEWLLRAASGLLLLPGARTLHGPLLELLRHMFESPGLELGPSALAMLVGDGAGSGGVLAPVVALSQVQGEIRLVPAGCVDACRPHDEPRTNF
jgi:hypothetical protein